MLGVPAGLASAVVALALVVDSVLDPITGYLSDNLRSRWGRRHPFMYASAIPVSLSYLLLWSPPAGLGPRALAAYLFAAAILVRSFITLYEVPSYALGPELSEDYHERTSYMGFRYLFGWIGGLTMYNLAFGVLLRPDASHPVGQLNPAGYHDYAVVASVIMFGSILLSCIGTHGAIKRLRPQPARRRISPRTAFREITQALGNPSCLALLGAGLLGNLSSGLGFALTPYFNTYFWQISARQITFIGVGGYASALGAMMVAPRLARRFGKKRAAIVTAFCTALLSPSIYLLRLAGLFPANGSPLLVPVLFLSSVLIIGLSIVPPILVMSMVSDVVEDNEIKTGRRTEGVLFAANAFMLKCVSGLGLAGSGLILSLAAFPQRAKPGHVAPETLVRFALLYAAALVLLNLGSIVFLRRYRISQEVHEANLRALAVRSGPASNGEVRLTPALG